MRSDYHVHTYYSDDSMYPMEDVIRDAIEKGIEELCITDHVDYLIKEDWPQTDTAYDPNEKKNHGMRNVKYSAWDDELKRMQKKYKDQITVRRGMEFGMMEMSVEPFQKLFDRYDFDFIILSFHQCQGKEIGTQEFQQGKSQLAYYQGYYDEMWRTIHAYSNWSVLGHMDLIVRYDKLPPLPLELVKEQVTAILKKVIADGKGIEVNTSSHRYGTKDSCPSREILQLYYDLGGRIITIGSDSHKPEHLGYGIGEAKDLLKEIGFTEFCTFEKMRPVFHPL